MLFTFVGALVALSFLAVFVSLCVVVFLNAEIGDTRDDF